MVALDCGEQYGRPFMALKLSTTAAGLALEQSHKMLSSMFATSEPAVSAYWGLKDQGLKRFSSGLEAQACKTAIAVTR